jgi:uncharacterized protein (TIGR00251 family)
MTVWERTADGLRVRVRVAPKASRNAVSGIKERPGGAALAVSVTTVPEGGKANQAVIKLLAKEWKMGKGEIEVVSGLTSRDKILKVSGDPADLAERLASWLEQADD